MINPVDFIHEETNLAKQMTSALGYAQPMVLPFRNIVVVSKGSNDKYVYENVNGDVNANGMYMGECAIYGFH